jgi:hypothetical protein
MTFLSKAEHDYLTANRQFNDDYSYTIKSGLQKKLQQFISQELPLLIEKGYLTEFCKLTENSEVPTRASLVRIAPCSSTYSEREDNDSKRWWVGGDLNPRSPPCQGGILTRLDHRPLYTLEKFVAQIYV